MTPLLCETLCISSRLFKAPLPNTQSALIGQLTLAWTNTANSNRAAVLNQFSGAKIVARHELCNCVTYVM